MAGFLELADGTRLPARDGMSFGRAPKCDIVLEDGKASRRHARLVVAGSVVELEDLGSSNGTFLNGVQVRRRLLRSGDKIVIGTTTMRFVEAPTGSVGSVRPPVDDVEELDFDAGDDDASDDSGGDESAAVVEEVSVVEESEPESTIIAPGRPDDPYRPGGGLEGDPLAASPVTSSERGREDDVEVLEFVDEVVEVKAKPRPAAAPSAPGSAARAGAAAGRGAASGGRKHGVLQFSEEPGRGGLLGDDLRQMSFGVRMLLVVLALAAAGGLGYLVMQLVAGS